MTFGGIAVGIVAVIGISGMLVAALLAPEQPQSAVSGAAAVATAPAEPETTVASTPAVASTAESAAPALEATAQPQTADPKVVAIDAGHQLHGDSSVEPIGPGASEKRAKVAGGARGVATGNSESSVNLAVAKLLRDELEAKGYKVVMVRTTQDVNIANSKRAKLANEAQADLFVRLHCDGSASSGTHGISTLIPVKNRWTKDIVSESARAGRFVHKAVVARTGAADRGVVKRGDLTGFNWSDVPTVLVEMGFMSNRQEDRKLDTRAYKQALAQGMAQGIDDYLGAE
ncbi:MAG: N-acetylmuramoyl-L-alanine amidase [Coriobacteriia bacterium]|nr:N-acetylmuramoyl-L-alanine amidase [Coriobacteriia bacterium]